MNVINIFKAWATNINPSDDERTLANERLDICSKCPFKVESIVHSDLNVCKVCQCPVSYKDTPIGKCYDKDNSCPNSYWVK